MYGSFGLCLEGHRGWMAFSLLGGGGTGGSWDILDDGGGFFANRRRERAFLYFAVSFLRFLLVGVGGFVVRLGAL